jgi:hypothetical protein
MRNGPDVEVEERDFFEVVDGEASLIEAVEEAEAIQPDSVLLVQFNDRGYGTEDLERAAEHFREQLEGTGVHPVFCTDSLIQQWGVMAQTTEISDGEIL